MEPRVSLRTLRFIAFLYHACRPGMPALSCFRGVGCWPQEELRHRDRTKLECPCISFHILNWCPYGKRCQFQHAATKDQAATTTPKLSDAPVENAAALALAGVPAAWPVKESQSALEEVIAKEFKAANWQGAVSYTHLTLPTICSV